MDIHDYNHDYNEDNLATVAGNCRFLSYKKPYRPEGAISGISCSDCRNWNGRNCTSKQFDRIASELQLD